MTVEKVSLQYLIVSVPFFRLFCDSMKFETQTRNVNCACHSKHFPKVKLGGCLRRGHSLARIEIQKRRPLQKHVVDNSSIGLASAVDQVSTTSIFFVMSKIRIAN